MTMGQKVISIASLAFVFAAAASTANVQAGEPDIAAGKDLFDRRCSGCHALDGNKEGPALRTVFGRRAGSAQSFAYSDALRQSGVVWDKASLDKWLENPEALAPGTNMEFRVPSAGERAALIDYLSRLRE
jgi:cytochrome c